MPEPAAEDRTTIRNRIEYERGIAAYMAGSPRECPADCMDRAGWLDGWNEAKRLRPNLGGNG